MALPIMLALCSMLSGTYYAHYYAHYYASIIGGSLDGIWTEIFDQYDKNVSTEVFTIIMNYLLDTLVPRKRVRIKQRCTPWSRDSEIAAARRQRNWLHRKALKSGSVEDWAVYKRSRNKVTTMVRLARQQYFSDVATNLLIILVNFGGVSSIYLPVKRHMSLPLMFHVLQLTNIFLLLQERLLLTCHLPLFLHCLI